LPPPIGYAHRSASVLSCKKDRPPHTCRHTPAAHQPPPFPASTMQSPASDRARSPDRYVVRLSGALAALLGQAGGAEVPED